MSRAGVLLTLILAIASIGVLAQDTTRHASAPPVASSQAAPSNSAPERIQSSQSSKPAQSSQTAAPSQEAQTGPASGASNDIGANGQLPQTSTILPLLGLIGLGSLVAGLFARR